MKKNLLDFWKDVLSREKILSNEEAEDIRKITVEFRKEKGYR